MMGSSGLIHVEGMIRIRRMPRRIKVGTKRKELDDMT